uniref:Uncharacterized protein n=1 Tax=Pyxicephalus adspersus TaxID=30357 RepID=A0AAV3AVB1_PYXAD|nr:TPA: hypothetical protein GDO54_008546 [Pyxicephalus adspersus]
MYPPMFKSPMKVMMMGSLKIAQLLIEHRADPTVTDPSTGTSPAHDAIREGFVKTFLELRNGEASLYGPVDFYGQRPIDLASDSVREELIRIGMLNPTENQQQ